MTEQDKQALIKHFCSRDCGEAAEGCTIMPCHEIELIQEFPTSEADSDTISRQQAIDICRAPHMRNADCSDFEMAIMMLPPAQPEIIRCRECKFASGDSRICMKFDHSPIGELDFCSFAERREVNNESN
jgi:hypothetical protein